MQIQILKMGSISENSASCFLPDYKTSETDDGNMLVRNLQELNLPEKIVLVIDTIRERDCTPFKLSNGTSYTPLFMIKRAVEQFICIKSTIQRNHEYALMILNSQSAEWICDFTTNTHGILDCLDRINEEIIENRKQKVMKREVQGRSGKGKGRETGRVKGEGGDEVERETEDKQQREEEAEEEEREGEKDEVGKEEEKERNENVSDDSNDDGDDNDEDNDNDDDDDDDDDINEKSYDLGQLFDTIKERLAFQLQTDEIIPKFVTRIILLYSRSNSIPKFDSSKASLDSLMKNPYFFVDVLYVHELPSSKNLCEEIYNKIAILDTKNVSYILEVGRNAAKLHDNMAQLLAHPLQRAPQKDICYKIYPFSASQEMYIDA